MKKPLRSSARGASFHTKHASNPNVVRVVLLDANSYLAIRPLDQPAVKTSRNGNKTASDFTDKFPNNGLAYIQC
jgi:hypothetical protein